ncbi:MAG: peptidoglycan bridge formation glycyltransferase FemA/FemB family protein [Bacteroidia bacterium]|nr:peptidoglycan bridge formation glycyltransferase FemA/FemB family protein [Bacteroidia bacterium]
MKYLSYENPEHSGLLSRLNTDWPIQFLSEYSRFIGRIKKEQLLIVYNESLNAFMPLRLFKASVFKFGQILHAPVCNTEELKQRDQLVFFNLLMMDLRSKNICDRLVQPHPYGILSALPPNTHYCEFGTYITDLHRLNPDEVFASISDKYQKAIKHSKKNGAVVRTGWSYFKDFYPLLKNTMQKAGIGVESVDYFNDLHTYLGDEFSTVAVVYDGELPVGGAFFLHSKYAAYCTHAGSSNKTKLYGAMKLLHFEMMLHFKSEQVKRYDLVGVRIQNANPALEGIFKFKKGFGGELKTGYLWKADLHKNKLAVFDWIQNLRGLQHKQRDIIDQVNN